MINGDPVRCTELSLPRAFEAYDVEKRTRRRKLLETTIVRIGDEKVPMRSTAIPVGRSNSPFACSLPLNMLYSFRQGARDWEAVFRHLVNDQAVIPVTLVLVHLLKISRIMASSFGR